MFIYSNLKFCMMAIIPALFYASIIYASSRYKSIDIKKGLIYLILGAISVTFVTAFQFTFPYFQEWNLSETHPVYSMLFKFIFQVALLEEMSKFISYKFIDSIRDGIHKDKPVATMFYACMVSAGFAVVENLHYVMIYYNQIDPGDLLLTRAITAVIAHMLCGLFMGYFIALGNVSNTNNDLSFFTLMFRKYKNIKATIFTVLGLLVAVTYHGIYDFLLSLNMQPFNILFLGLLIAFFMHKKLNNISNDKTITYIK